MCQPSAQPPSAPPPLPSAQLPALLKASLSCAAHSPEVTAHSSAPFVVAAPVPFCLLGSQWGLGSGSQGFSDIGWRQEVVVGGDLSSHLSEAICTYWILHVHLFFVISNKSGVLVPVSIGYFLETLVTLINICWIRAQGCKREPDFPLVSD